jgi:DNA-binding transcriptional LysR family regulator
MDTSFYSEFIAIVKNKNFAEAADEMNMSSSSLSRHLKSAEEELGVELFSRMSRGVELNEYGEAFLEFAKKMVYENEKFMGEIKKKVESKKNVVYYCGNYVSNIFVAPFKMQYQDFIVNQIYNDKDPLTNLLNGACDISIYISKKEPENVDFKTVGKDRLVVAFNENHELAGRETVSVEELKNCQFIAILSRINNKSMNMDIFTKLGIKPNINLVSFSGEEALLFVSKGYGVSIMMKNLALRSEISSVKFAEIEGEGEYKIYMCRRKGEKLNNAANTLWNFTEEIAE